jgi:hypothetical protein
MMAMENRVIRPATYDDIPVIMRVMDSAKLIMRHSGNMQQWEGGYPSETVIASDIQRNGAYIVEDKDIIVSYFACLPSPEPTYHIIYDGQWLDDTRPYHTIHRIGSLPNVHGIFDFIMDSCFAEYDNIRIDTHRDNKIMQHVILEYGFSYCGVIHLASGDERLAYQRMI